MSSETRSGVPTGVALPSEPAAPRRAPRDGGKFRMRRLGVEPAAKLFGLAIATGARAIALALAAPFSSRAARARRRAAFREQSVERLAGTLGSLKGVFVKAAQFAAHRPDVLAGAGALARLRDEVAPLPFPIVRATVERELGAPLEVLFADFDPEPLGAASVAQVHAARLPGGESVAVKVQYPWLADSLPADLAILRALLSLATWLGPLRAVDRDRLFEEFAAGLREELDFEREAASAREIAANLAHDPQVVVPEVVPSHSSRRVLTTSRVAAVRISDAAGLARLGVAPRAALEVIARAYAKQVFVDGLFHADPHPGNLFVIDEPGAAERPRVLFVDFGLSRRLDAGLRRELRQALLALVRRDTGAFVAGMDRLGMIAPGALPRVRAAVSGMLDRLAAEGGPLTLAGSRVLALKDEAKQLLGSTPGLQLPHDLLLFAKTLSYVFALGRDLDPDADLVRAAMPFLLRFLGEREA